jgi:hypothetical protein
MYFPLGHKSFFTPSYVTDVYVRCNLVIVDSTLVFRYGDTSAPCVKAGGDPESSPSLLVRPVLNLSIHSQIFSTAYSYRHIVEHFVFGLCNVYCRVPIPVAARTKAWFFGRSLAGIAGSNPAGEHVCLL